MNSAIQRLAFIPCSIALFTGCSAATQPSDPGGTSDSRNGEKTGTTSEAVNPACGSPVVFFSGIQTEQGYIIARNFTGWCFNGGDTVSVYLVDDTQGQTILSQTTAQASPDGDSNTWYPGAIQGDFYWLHTNFTGVGANDHLQILAVDPLIGVAWSSCFTPDGSSC